jgi:hypothetical protein
VRDDAGAQRPRDPRRDTTQLGFKMVKYLRAIEVVDAYRTIRKGMGGIREYIQQFYMSYCI